MNKKEILFGLLITVALAIFIAPFASSWPDGLEKVAETLGFIGKGEVRPIIASPIPDYAWPGVNSQRLATSLAGFLGTILVFLLAYGLALAIRKQNNSQNSVK